MPDQQIFVPCSKEIDYSDVVVPITELQSKAFFVDQSNLLLTGALSFLASLAINSFVQSLFGASINVDTSKPWEAIVYSLVYVIVVVAVALSVMLPLAKAKSKRDTIAKNEERKIPILVKPINYQICGTTLSQK